MGSGTGSGEGKGEGRYTGKKCRLICMFALTSSFFLVEIVVGYLTNSMALVADSFHMLSDIAALVIAFLSVRMAPKSWSKNTFGWARAEVLGALVNAVFLVALCFSITVESLKRFYEPEDIHNPQLILWVGAMGLLVNLVGLCLFAQHGSGHGHSHGLSRSTHSHLTDLADKDDDEKDGIPEISYTGAEKAKPAGGHGHSHGGGDASNMNMKGVFLHVMADALGSVIVIISALIMWLTDWEYKEYVDPGLSLLLVVLILRSVWPLLIESALILLQTVPTHIQVDSLQQKLMAKVDGILAVHEFHIWQLAGDRIIASAHIRCLNLAQYMQVAEKVKEFFHNEGIHSTTIQPEFVETSEPSGSISSTQDCMLSCPKAPGVPGLGGGGCDASKCCPPPSQPSPSESERARRPSSVSITQEVGAGMTVSTPSMRSAPNLTLDTEMKDMANSTSDNTVELTTELDLSDMKQTTSKSTKTELKAEESGQAGKGSKTPPSKPAPFITSNRRSKSPGSSSRTPPRTSPRSSPGKSGPPSLEQEQDSGEETPMVGPRTKARVVKGSKQSNV